MNGRVEKYGSLVGGLAIAPGVGTRWASLALAIFLVPTTGLSHGPSGLDAAAAQMQTIQVDKNLAIAGGLLALSVFGGGPLALEARIRRSRQPGRLGFHSITRTGVQS